MDLISIALSERYTDEKIESAITEQSEQITQKFTTKEDMQEHSADDSIHVTSVEKERWDGKEDASNKGEVGGYAELDSSAKIPLDQLPDAAKSRTYVVQDSIERESLSNMLVGDKSYEIDTGDSYIWVDATWISMEEEDEEIPLASEDADGLLASEDFVKLKNITPSVERKVMVFIVPQEIYAGIQDPHVVFPFDGVVEDISASVSDSGDSNTTVRVEKSVDYTKWKTITDIPIMIELKNNFDNGKHEIIDTEVAAGDVFRINAPITGDITNLTVNITVRV